VTGIVRALELPGIVGLLALDRLQLGAQLGFGRRQMRRSTSKRTLDRAPQVSLRWSRDDVRLFPHGDAHAAGNGT
jgi:hypothetical protein